MDLVTETDKECEKLIFGRLKEAFPDHNFIGEEESSAQGFTAGLTQAPTWMVDPVDGERGLPSRTHKRLCMLWSAQSNGTVQAAASFGALVSACPVSSGVCDAAVKHVHDLREALPATTATSGQGPITTSIGPQHG